jgi:mono/diheme cytochrome c family protein
VRSIWAFGLFSALLLSACTGLAGEVAIVATATPRATAAPVAVDRGYPAAPPNLAEGERLYAQHCTACHAPNGSGQGELVLSGQVPAMQSFLDADAMRSKTPAQYFEIITQGNLANLMPPWKDAFTEQQRWDVAHYTLFMHYTQAQLARGQQLYEQVCAECSGTPSLEIGGRTYTLTDPRDMAFLSDRDIVEAMREGRSSSAPVLDAATSDEDAYAIAAYLRTLSTTREAAVQAEPTFNPDAFDITGQVRNATTGQLAPQGLPVYLNYGSASVGLNTLQTTVDADGRYMFENVPRLSESAYFVYTLYSGVTFDGGVRRVEDVGAALDVPLTIYETTDDLALIRLARIDTQMEPFPALQEGPSGSGLLVTQTFTFENVGDRAFVLSQAGRTFSVLLTMPPGSIALNALNDRRFIVAQEQFAVIYAMGLPPGETRIELVYFWPYSDGAVFDQVLNYPYDGEITLTIAPKSVTLRDTAGWTVDTSAPFVNQYRRTVSVPRGRSLVFDLVGSVTPTVGTGVVTADALLPALIVIGMAALAVMAVFLWLKRRSTPSLEALLQQIAQLDALHERGQINHDAYQRQRKALKEQAAVLMAAQRPPQTPPPNE